MMFFLLCHAKVAKLSNAGLRLVTGWVAQALEQGRSGSYAHAGYHQYYNGVGSV